MVATIKLSENGLKIVDQIRLRKGWAKTEKAWYELAYVSKSTLKRFWKPEEIRQELFVKICEVIGIKNWEELIENYPSQPEKETSASDAPWWLVLSAEINEINRPQVLAIVELLKTILGEEKLTLKEVIECCETRERDRIGREFTIEISRNAFSTQETFVISAN